MPWRPAAASACVAYGKAQLPPSATDYELRAPTRGRFVGCGSGFRQQSHAVLSHFVAIDGFQLFGLALPIFLLACLGLAAKSRLPLTVATHLSPVYAVFLLLSWRVGVPTTTQASLGPIAVPSGAGLYVMATILGTCLLSVVVTHLHYVFAVGKEIRALVSWLERRALAHRKQTQLPWRLRLIDAEAP